MTNLRSATTVFLWICTWSQLLQFQSNFSSERHVISMMSLSWEITISVQMSSEKNPTCWSLPSVFMCVFFWKLQFFKWSKKLTSQKRPTFEGFFVIFVGARNLWIWCLISVIRSVAKMNPSKWSSTRWFLSWKMWTVLPRPNGPPNTVFLLWCFSVAERYNRISWVVGTPSQDSSGKWRFSSGSPILKI